MSDVTTTMPPEEKGLRGFFLRRWRVLQFLVVESGVARDPVILFTLLASASRMGLMYLINEMVQNLGAGRELTGALLIGAAAVLLYSSYQSHVRAHRLTNRIKESVRIKLVRDLMRADIDFLLSRDHGRIYSVITGEVDNVSGAIISVVTSIESVIVVAFAVPYLFYISPEVGLATLAAIGIGTTGYVLMDLPARRLQMKAAEARAEFCDRVNDMLAGWKELRLRDSRRAELEAEGLRVVQNIGAHSLRAERLYSGSSVAAQSAVVMLLCFVVVGIPFLTGAGTAELFQILTVVLLSSGPIDMLFRALPALSSAEAAKARIDAVSDALQAARAEDDNTKPALERFSEITLTGIEADISEPGRPLSEAFHLGPVDLTMKAGEVVFICGGNGSGKTTLLSIIAGLRYAAKGEIRLDGETVGHDDLARYRTLFSGVFSGFHLFDRTYGLTDDEVALLQERIVELSLSDRVDLRERQFKSLSLSAGQKRRLALAVSLAEERPIIVLDEFAADQDPANRAFFYDTLVPELAAKGHLVIAVTHDDHQFHKCDRLIKMAGGRVVSEEMDPQAVATE